VQMGLLTRPDRTFVWLIDDGTRVERVSASSPDATLRDIARAALYAATNPTPANEAITARLYDFAIAVRRLA
jgi:hypothetical protein